MICSRASGGGAKAERSSPDSLEAQDGGVLHNEAAWHWKAEWTYMNSLQLEATISKRGKGEG